MNNNLNYDSKKNEKYTTRTRASGATTQSRTVQLKTKSAAVKIKATNPSTPKFGELELGDASVSAPSNLCTSAPTTLMISAKCGTNYGNLVKCSTLIV